MLVDSSLTSYEFFLNQYNVNLGVIILWWRKFLLANLKEKLLFLNRTHQFFTNASRGFRWCSCYAFSRYYGYSLSNTTRPGSSQSPPAFDQEVSPPSSDRDDMDQGPAGHDLDFLSVMNGERCQRAAHTQGFRVLRKLRKAYYNRGWREAWCSGLV